MTETNHCPRCVRVGLFLGEARSLHPRACGQCGGVWLATEEAARVLRPLFTPSGLPGGTSRLTCPICAEPMRAWPVGETGVELDSCAAHGTWFDRDELERLAIAAADLRGVARPDFSRLHARDLAPAAVAGAAAAIAAHAVTSGALASAMHEVQSREGATTDLLANSDVAVAAVDLTISAGQVAADAGVEAAGAAADAAGGLLDGLIEFVSGLFS